MGWYENRTEMARYVAEMARDDTMPVLLVPPGRSVTRQSVWPGRYSASTSQLAGCPPAWTAGLSADRCRSLWVGRCRHAASRLTPEAGVSGSGRGDEPGQLRALLR